MNINSTQNEHHILVASRGPDDFRSLLYVGYSLARAHHTWLTIVTVTSIEEQPEWFEIPAAFADVPIETRVLHSESPAKAILKYARQSSPNLLLVSWSGEPPRQGYMLGSTLDPILQQAPCDIMVLKARETWPEGPFLEQEIKVLVPTAMGPNAPLAIDLALNLSDRSRVTALYVTHESEDRARVQERERWLEEFVQPWADSSRFQRKIIQSNSVLHGILSEAKDYDLTILGASNESIFSQMLFGQFPQAFAAQNEGPTIIVKRFHGSFGSFLRRS